MCFMTFNDVWHISEMLGTSKFVSPFGQWCTPRAMGEGGILPHSACRYGHLSGVTHGFALRALSLRDDVSPFGRVPSIRRRFVSAHSPVLKSGVTTNIAFWANHVLWASLRVCVLSTATLITFVFSRRFTTEFQLFWQMICIGHLLAS